MPKRLALTTTRKQRRNSLRRLVFCVCQAGAGVCSMFPVRHSLCLLFAASALFSGCAPQGTPSTLLSLDGPPLPILGTLDNAPLRGVMDRSCLAGVGSVALNLPGKTGGTIFCKGIMDQPGNEKGRLYVELACDDGSAVVLALRNLGPDQGMGIGRHGATGDRITLFYHPSEDEALRRLARVREDLARAEEALAGQKAAKTTE